MQSMITGMTNNVEQVVKVFDTGHISIVSADYEAEKEYMPVQYPVAEGRSFADVSAQIKTIPGIKAVFPRITAYATLQDSTIKHALLLGLNIGDEMALNHFNQAKRTDGLLEGRYPAVDSDECAIGVHMVEKAGYKIGDRIPLKTVSAQFSDKMWSPKIVGIFEYDYFKYDESAIVVSFDRLQRLLVMEGGTQQVIIFVDRESANKTIANQVQAMVGDTNIVRVWQDNYFVALLQQSMALFILIEAVFVIVASFLIVNTVVMIIHERIKEIGMMGSLGMKRGEIVQVFFFEAVFMSVLGSLAGVFVGGIITAVGSLFPLSFNAMMGGGFNEFPVSGTLFLAFSPNILLMGFIFGTVVASICTLIPSLRSAFVEPVEALRR
jgi:putative ABC transport system permease protein